jgi:drug/metabolite transporter (DMT)-like permease
VVAKVELSEWLTPVAIAIFRFLIAGGLFLVALFSGLCLIPFYLAENSFHEIFTVTLYGWLTILFLSIACSVLGYHIWFYVLNQVGAAVTSSFLFAEPLVTVLFAFAFFEEEISLSIILGSLLILMGVKLVTAKKKLKVIQNSPKQF